MKKLVVAIAALLALGIGAGQAGEKVRVATEGAYPPFNFVDKNGQLQGFDVEIANALCAAMKAECTIVAQDWDGIIPGLLAKKYDAIIASMSITPERRKRVSFTNKYYETPLRFVAKKGSGVEISKAGLKGKVIGAQRMTTGSDYAEKSYGDVAPVKLYDTYENALLDLVTGRVDTVAADGIPLAEWLDTKDGQGFEFVGQPVKVDEGIGIAVRQQDTGLLAKLNAAIAQIRNDGTYQKINAKYFPFDLYGD
ncbi:MAG: ABC transporter substrate-binding protein [Kiloniellales bacterium]